MGAHRQDKEPDAGQFLVAKTRRCLMCSTAFNSAWAGERICRRCKRNGTWEERQAWADDEPLPVVHP